MEKLDLKEFKKSLELAFKAGRISVNTSFGQWFDTFMNKNGYKSIAVKPNKMAKILK